MDKSKKRQQPIIIERKSKRVYETDPETMEAEGENIEEVDPITAETADENVEEVEPIRAEPMDENMEETDLMTEETGDESEEEMDRFTDEETDPLTDEADPITNQSEDNERRSYRSNTGSSLDEVDLLRERIGEDVLIVLEAPQLNILGQVFRPIFTGRIIEVTVGSILLENVIIKMPNAPFFQFPTPLSFPIQKVVGMTRFDPTTRIPIL